VDIFASCCGFIAIVEGGRLAGYNLTAGGGMGRTHGNQTTFPRLADVVGFVRPENVKEVATAVLTVHRDFGDRTNRKHARLKYVLEDKGVVWFKNELESRLGFTLGEARPFHFEKQGDDFGWRPQADGRWYLGLFVETGRIKDLGDRRMKTALREVIQRYQPEIRLTPANNVLLVGIRGEQRTPITEAFARHGLDLESQGSVVRRASMACVALPTCGLALAESERFLPGWITQLEPVLNELGLSPQEISIRMTGCPNGCARPYLAEIGFVGKAPGRYQIYLGGDHYGMRLNRLYLDNVKDTDLIPQLRPLLARYAAGRLDHERFGDWCAREIGRAHV
jgi:sulfite reductase (NADPH) hemoprotein beta-component